MNMAYFLFLGIISRFLPHPANFTPIGSFILFGSKKNWIYGSILGLIIMISSDLILGFSHASPFVYIGMLSYSAWGFLLKKRFGHIYAPLLGSTSFFIISNLGVWMGPWYENNLQGLIQCYTMALPFFKNTLISDLAYTNVIYLVVLFYKHKKGEIWQKKYQTSNLRIKS